MGCVTGLRRLSYLRNRLKACGMASEMMGFMWVVPKPGLCCQEWW